jgi:hypothetical protein
MLRAAAYSREELSVDGFKRVTRGRFRLNCSLQLLHSTPQPLCFAFHVLQVPLRNV